MRAAAAFMADMAHGIPAEAISTDRMDIPMVMADTDMAATRVGDIPTMIMAALQIIPASIR